MSYYLNPFNEYQGYYTVGDSSGYKLTFKVPGNKNFTEFFICWNAGPYNLSSDSVLTFFYAFDPSFKNWSSFDIDIAGANPAVTTAFEIVAILNADSKFNSWYTASVYNQNQVGIRQKRPIVSFHTYISGSGAEHKLKFNKQIGIADIPSYFEKDTIDNRFNSDTANGALIRLGKIITANTVANPSVCTCTGHGLSNGDVIYIANSNSTPVLDGAQTVTVINPNTFSVPVNVTTAGTFAEFFTQEEYDLLVDLGIDYTKLLTDYEHLKGRCPAFQFTKNTLDGSSRIILQITYAAGSTPGMLGKKTIYTYTGIATTPTTITEMPHVLTAADILTP
jgi:hypothetical protein